MVILKKKNALMLSLILATQSMQGCILDDVSCAIHQLWSNIVNSDVSHSLSQVMTDGESWIRKNPQDAAVLVAFAAFMTFLIMQSNTQRKTHSVEFFSGFEQGQGISLQREAYRQGWHDAIAYIERMDDSLPQESETDLYYIEFQRAFQNLVQLCKGEPIDEMGMYIKSGDLEIEVIIDK